jgi:hypothetical protein
VCALDTSIGVDQLGVFEAKIKRIKGLFYIWPLDFLLAPLCSSLLPSCDFLPQYLSEQQSEKQPSHYVPLMSAALGM